MPSVPTWFLRPCFANTRQYEEHANLLQLSLQGANGKHVTWNADPQSESFDGDFAYDPQLLCGELPATWDLSNLSDLSSEMDSRPLDDIPLIVVSSLLVDDPVVKTRILQRLSRTLHPTLTATFLDGAPVVFSPSANPTETEVQTLMAAFRITRALYGAILQSDDLVRGLGLSTLG